MSRPFTIPALSRFLLLMALVLAMSARGAVPDGYMVDRSASDGSLIIRICGGLDDRFMRLDPETGQLSPVQPGGMPADLPENEDTGTHGTCPFALTAVFDLPQPAALAGPAAFGQILLAGRVYHPPLVPSPASAPLPPRGPPLTA